MERSDKYQYLLSIHPLSIYLTFTTARLSTHHVPIHPSSTHPHIQPRIPLCFHPIFIRYKFRPLCRQYLLFDVACLRRRFADTKFDISTTSSYC
ncbi:hypothetical protein EGR_06431 [Echinococcus granulosus]|uniref:Uncharacterized protein n=1 Tax=Echinococcus granulosus TaxID=6210 RepID=W6UC49_ECHGR|nr:hypothetical protein EGR_06431 [Echinococcus granulosus]EUB58760.1 hypothetical protein EGR_06431 [Echinococcus granulosus]